MSRLSPSLKSLLNRSGNCLAAKGQEGSPFLTIMEEYLPKAVSEEEIRAWIEGNLDFSTFANRMQAMRPIMNHFGSAADGNVVKKILMSYSLRGLSSTPSGCNASAFFTVRSPDVWVIPRIVCQISS